MSDYLRQRIFEITGQALDRTPGIGYTCDDDLLCGRVARDGPGAAAGVCDDVALHVWGTDCGGARHRGGGLVAVLALDVSFRHTGWAVLRGSKPIACGCIHTDRSKYPAAVRSQAQRDIHDCQLLASQLREIASFHGITEVVAEVPGGNSQGARAGACMAMAKAAAAVALADYPCVWRAPRVTKGAATARVLERWPDFQGPKLIRDAEHVFDCLSVFLDAAEVML